MEYNETSGGYSYYTALPKGVYMITGSVDKNILSMCEVIDGMLTVGSDIKITAGNITVYYGSSDRFKVVISDDNGKVLEKMSVKITINGQTYEKTTNGNGVTSIALNLNSGEYDVICECDSIFAYSTVTIRDTVISADITKIYKNATRYSATFVDSKGTLLKNTKIQLNINGILYERKTNNKGMAHMNINLNPGTYVLTAINPSSGEFHTNTVRVVSSIINNNDLTKYYRNASKYKLCVLDSSGKTAGAGKLVTLNINGVLYEKKTNASVTLT